MQTETALLILLAAIVALAVVLYQYYFKAKRRGKLSVVLSFLRFLALFGLFILLINPKFSKNEYTIEKTNLVVLADNSSSMEASKAEVSAVLEKVYENKAIAERFDLKQYRFGASLTDTDSLSFHEKNTNISKALSAIQEVYNNTNTAVLLVSDGNQTIGADYGFRANSLAFPIYPIAIGDTTRYEDLRVDQLNVNRYAFLKNKYPIEAYISYEGSGSVSSVLNISINGKTAYRETVKLSNSDNTKVINAVFDAASVGVKSVTVSLQPIENERNIANNQKSAAIEVIDEKTNITIISNVLHPDIGALTKAIESNEQRQVSLKKPSATQKELEEVDVFILYQPTAAFKSVFEYIRQKKASSFVIAGNQTNWTFLNGVQQEVRIEDGYPNQEISPVLNPSFSKFDITDFSLDDFPPLDGDPGSIEFDGDSEALMTMRIRGVGLNNPLFLVNDIQGVKQAFLFGENIWKWRMQTFRNDQNFENFDSFLGKLILYLSTNKSKNRLNVDHNRIYYGSGDSKITATYFDEAFVFDNNATISLTIKGKDVEFSKEIPMLLKGGFYEADVLGLPAGDYSFTVTEKDENRSKSGSFTVLEFDVEQQLLSTDYKKLDQLAKATEGQLYFPSEIDSLILELSDSNRFAPTRKGTKNVVSLIDFRILMAIIAAALALEWFIRKYNGLI